jgi:ATP-independent RNA helicase DbpA
LQAPFITLAVDAGRQQKLRPGDLLGALTGDAGLPATAVGKIDVFPTRSYVAVALDWYEKAFERLRAGKIKGRTIRVRRIGG